MPSTLAAVRPLADSTLRGRTVDQLKSLIVSGDLAAGARLTEIELAEALGISRGPLREAIRELVDIGLVVSKPYKGLFVRDITLDDLNELYSLRTALEQFAFRQCWDKRDGGAVADLHNRNALLSKTIDADADPYEAILAELDLHSWCYELSGHRLLQQSWARMKPNLQFYFAMHQQAHGRKGPLRDAHDTYVGLACGDDLDAMLRHLDDHMRQGLEKTKSFITAS
ncbi:GntR family transcriptional regulator [Hoeflea sp.]|uniref:GntR family transcriptional regulator n=1 Tax=Hoeflea sp. TaxID=1940281 RepID=UPI003B021174